MNGGSKHEPAVPEPGRSCRRSRHRRADRVRFVLCPMIALLLGGPRQGLSWAGIVVATLIALFAAEHGGVAMQAYPVSDPRLLDLASHVGLAVLAAVVVLLALDSAGGQRP